MLLHKSSLESWCGGRRGLFINLFVFASAVILIAFPQLLLKSDHSVRIANCFQKTGIHEDLKQQRAEFLRGQWDKLYFGNSSKGEGIQNLLLGIPAAPHIQDCEKQSSIAIALDSRSKDGKRPQWTYSGWTSELSSQFSDADEEHFDNKLKAAEGPHPPWIKGGDGDNLPMTRQAQTDLWLHQHPKNCSAESVRFLVNDWINSPKLGLGAQIVAMAGIFAIALNEKRVLVTQNFNRADHDECKGSSRGEWSCYFAPETSQECIDRARKLVSQKRAWKKGIVVNVKPFPKDAMWFGGIPEYWGKPWEAIEPLEVVDGNLVGKRNAADRQWWRAQAVKYFTRFQSQYLCSLMNDARHHAFGKLAAEAVLEALPLNTQEGPDISKELWIDQSPWKPTPLVSIHVRQGDKAKEMKVFEFSSYMKLADEIQLRFPHVRHAWLSTEMENVVEESRNYTNWRFYYTNVPRQNGTTSMGAYETSLGRITSSNNAFVNLMMAADCDYFVGALGSTWSFIVDGLRITGGKLQNGFLSVNKDRYW